MTQTWDSGMNACGLALSQITYLIASLTKKNNKSSIVELSQLVDRHGEEAEKHLFHTLFTHVEFSSDGKSTGKDFHQTQLLIQESANIMMKPNFVGVLCHATNGVLRGTPSLFPSLVKVLRLSALNEIVFALALIQSPDPDIQKQAIAVLDSKLCDILSLHVRAENGETPLKELPIHVVYFAISYLFKDNGILSLDKEGVLEKLNKHFPIETCPIILVPLLHSMEKISSSINTSGSVETEPHNLAALIRECGYTCCDNIEELQELFTVVKGEITARTVAKTLGMMIAPNTSGEMVSLQSIHSSSSWSDKSDTTPITPTAWNVDNFCTVLKQKVKQLDWGEVIIELDYPEFLVSDVSGVNLILKAYHLGTTDPFPVTAIYRQWANVKGHLSWIRYSLDSNSDFSFTKNLGKPVELEILKSPPEEGIPEIQVWTSLDLVETLLNIGECGEGTEVLSILSKPAKLCPDILMLCLLQSKCNWHSLQDDMIRSLLQTFLGNHPNSAILLHYCWSGPQGRQSTLQPLMLQAMADYYMQDQTQAGQVDQTRLSRILDVAQDLKTLSQLLNSSPFLFVIDLAVLASRREYLKLDKWLTDKLLHHKEAFTRATITFLKRRLEKDGPKNPPLPQEVIVSILQCLQHVLQQSSMWEVPLSNEAQEAIHHLTSAHLPTSPNTMTSLPSNNIGLPVQSSISAMNSLQQPPMQSKLPQLIGHQTSTQNTAVTLGNGLSSVLGGGITSLTAPLPQTAQPPLLQHYQSASPPIQDSSFSAVVVQQQRRSSLSQPAIGQPSSLLDQTGIPGLGQTSLSQPMSTIVQSSFTQSPLSLVNSPISMSQNPLGQNTFHPGLSKLGQTGLGQSSLGPQLSQSPLGQGPIGQNPMNQNQMGQNPMGQNPMGQNPMGQNPMGQSGLGQSSLGGLGKSMGQSSMLGQGLGQSLGGQGGFSPSALGQGSLGGLTQHRNPALPSDMSKLGGGMEQQFESFPKEIDDEANSYFQKIYNKTMSIPAVLDMLKKFQDSPIKKERDIFNCMLRNLFEEYRFYHQYPEAELKITGKLFGGIIERSLVYYLVLGYALRYIIESLKNPPNSKMYMFGISALEEFRHRLKDYPQYCQHLAMTIPHFKEFPPQLIEYIEHGRESMDPPSKNLFTNQTQSTIGMQQSFMTNSSQMNLTGMQQQQQHNQQQQQQQMSLQTFQSMLTPQVSSFSQAQNIPSMFGQSSLSGGSSSPASVLQSNMSNSMGSGLFNNVPPSSSPMSSSPLNSFSSSLQNVFSNSNSFSTAKPNIGSSLGNIGSSLGGNSNFHLPPASSPSIMAQLTNQGRSTPPKPMAVGAQSSQNQQVRSQSGGWPTSAPPILPSTSTGLPQPPSLKTPPPSSTPQEGMLQGQDEKKIVQDCKILHQPPPEGVQDKILFIFNNISQDNLSQKVEEWMEVVEQQFYPWAAQYLVMERVSIEPNFHQLYIQFVVTLSIKEYSGFILTEAFHNIKVLLKSPNMTSSFSDRSLLKNLGSFLGQFTLGRNKPILQIDLDLKSLIIEGYHKGLVSGNKQEYLLFVLPFVCNVLKHVADSVVFAPPNAWTMGIVGLLVELHSIQDLKLALKFEMELLCKALDTEMSSVTIKDILKEEPLLYRTEQLVSLTPPTNPTTLQPAAFTPSTLNTAPPPPLPQIIQFNDMSSMSDSPKMIIDPALPLFQTHPHLQHCVKTAIDSAVSKVTGIVLQRTLMTTVTTAEKLIKKDFALDPEESKMRLAAHYMVRHIAAAMVLITAQEALHEHIRKNLEQNFHSNGLGTTRQELMMVQEAANRIASDNLELACVRLQTDAVRLAFKKIDESLEGEYRKRCQCRKDGHRFTNPMVAQIQADLPEPLRQQPGGCTAQQFTVYTQFGKNIPASLPMPSALPTIPTLNSQIPTTLLRDQGLDKWNAFDQNTFSRTPDLDMQGGFDSHLRHSTQISNRMPALLQQQHISQGGFGEQRGGINEPEISRMVMYKSHNDEFNRYLDSIQNELDQLLPQFPSTSFLRHPLERLLKTVNSTKLNTPDSMKLIVYSVEGILEYYRPEVMQPERANMNRLCEAHIRVLKYLAKPVGFGQPILQKHVTKVVIEARDELKFNEHGIEKLIHFNMLSMKDFCIHLAQYLEAVASRGAISSSQALLFCVNLCKDHRNDTLVSKGDVQPLMEALQRIATFSSLQRHNPAPEQPQLGLIGEPQQLTSPDHLEDPPGMREKVELYLQHWIQLCTNRSGENIEQKQHDILNMLHSFGFFRSDETMTHFFRVCMEKVAELSYRIMMTNKGPVHAAREEVYHGVDAFVRLVMVLLKINGSGDPAKEQNKIKLLNKVLLTVKGVLQKDHDTRTTNFYPLPYHRFLAILFSELCADRQTFDKFSYQILQDFCNVYHALQPNIVPGFAYSWLELISSRSFLPKLLANPNPDQKGTSPPGWALYQQLLIDLFKFLSPFLQNAELNKSTQLLYKGTNRVLLVLLHDFPEFLCEYHFGFCDVIPPCCLQLRNLILSAFPRSMIAPDPFGKDLKVDQLEMITESPRISLAYTAAIKPATFKKDLDSYLKSRTPVTFLTELRRHLEAPIESESAFIGVRHDWGGENRTNSETGSKYNIPLMNALVLYVGVQAINLIHGNSHAPTQSTIAHSAHMDIFQHLAIDLDNEGRYLFLNAICNQLRYPNSHTHYFSCTLLYLFAEGHSEIMQEQITRILLERLCVNKPHPWGLLITFIELMKNRDKYKFWDHDFVRCAPEIEKLFTSVFNNLQPRNNAGLLAREETE